ncbi:MAG TPA: cytochrome P450 [Burkholderiaceae bacterium]|nr:cytochrome P450 [Burkholderiaceae bacterium]
MDAQALESLRNEIRAMPLDQIDVSKGYLYQQDTAELYFERLRREAPVHLCVSKRYGPYWSVTTYRHIVEIETNHQAFSSEASLGGISLAERPPEERFPSFIAMDPPRHTAQRKTVSPMLTPDHLATMEDAIRERAARVLDGLPIGEEFDWVQRVSIELTTQMLAQLFDFPFEERRLLTWWSDMATGDPGGKGLVTSWEMRLGELEKCRDYFVRLWNERVNAPPRADLVSMLAHSPGTRDMDADEYLGNIILLIVGGNDTTRNSMSGGLLALNRFPDEYRRLRENPSLVASMVPEIIRWQTPLSHMRRTAIRDTEVGGKLIRAGDKVVMWYLSANRDSEAIDEPHRFIIDRQRPKKHLSFGFGIHHCVGNRLAELQLRILWEEILKRFPVIEVTGTPQRTLSNFVHGFVSMPVRIPARY